MRPGFVLTSAAMVLALYGRAAAEGTGAAKFQAPPGFVVEQVAAPPLVKYPLFAAFDDRGRLFVAEGTGLNVPGEELEKVKLGRILRLEDTDGDGHFDDSRVFADGLVFPQGVLWHDGALYAASHPSLWRFEDTDDDGRADKSEPLVSGFNFNGNGCDIHGPFLGPDGWLYWTDGRHGYKVECQEGEVLEGLASRIWRCRPDGTGVERVAGGGFDNPVELIFTPEGDCIGTMDQGPGDALLHYIEGGVYPMDHPSVKEFVMTGPMLPAVFQYTASLPVALCGMCRYEGVKVSEDRQQLGAEYEGSLFTAQFNVHRIQQHILTRQGSTYTCENKDFITSLDYDVHLSDVLEDADGSLLFVDMGAWFNYGCPTSKIAKPEILGAIYRVRRADALPVEDPWGKSLKLAERTAAELVELLDDPRPKVRELAVARLARLGDKAALFLSEQLGLRQQRGDANSPIRRKKSWEPKQQWSLEKRRNAVWVLCRIGTRFSSIVLYGALADPDVSVRQAAAHAQGLMRGEPYVPSLYFMAIADDPALRLKAAEALGRIGGAEAVQAILKSLRRGVTDRHLEHALIYALIQIYDREATLAALTDPNPRVRQAGLIALDQMPGGDLTRELVVPLLDTDDADLQQAALDVMSRREGWSDGALGLMQDWLANPELSDGQQTSLTGLLLAFCSDQKVQGLVEAALSSESTSKPTRLLLLGTVARSRLETLPEGWLAALGKSLDDDNAGVRREAISAIKTRGLTQFDSQLVGLSASPEQPVDLRVAALECVAARLPRMEADSFALLISQLSEDAEPLVRVAAARTLGASTLDRDQLAQVAEQVAQAGPIVAPLLATAFSKAQQVESGLALVQALEKSPGAEALTADDLDRLLTGFPMAVQQVAQPLRQRLAGRQAAQAEYLTGLMLELLQHPGSVDRGREAFFSKKVGCFVCHRTAGKGGAVGPDLSQVGRFRAARDLLEAIVYPSSTVVPHFRSYTVATKDGRVETGLIVRETSDAVYLRTPQLAEVRIASDDVEEIAPAKLSLMPDGLEKTMTRQELSDLVEFLYQQR